MEKVRFFAKGAALVPDFNAAKNGVRRFICRKWAPVDSPSHPGGKGWAWIPLAEPQEVDLCVEYIRAASKGDLWPADVESADACGVAFDPTFGGDRAKLKVPGDKPADKPMADKSENKGAK